MTATTIEPADEVMLRVLRRPAVRACIVAPVVGLVIYALAGGRVGDSEVFIAMTATALVLALVGFVSPWDAGSDDPTARSLRGMWLVAAGTVGIALLPPVLVVALEVEVQVFSPVIATVLVVGIYAYPPRLRWPLTAWALGVWLITLLWSGSSDVGVLIANLGGGLLVVAATVRVADGLVASLAEANRARQESERRATLLSTVLRTHSLDPADVLRATTTGLMETGLDVAVIRSIDRERGVAVLVDGVARGDLELREEIPIDRGPIAECIEHGHRVRFDQLREADTEVRSLGPDRLQGSVLIPLFDGDEVTAVAAGASTSGPLSDQQVEAAELLAAQAARALARARRFEADRRTLAELRRLDVRTQDFVSTVSHELRTPLTVIHGLGGTLLSRWDDLDEGRRNDLLRRIAANAERLSAMVRSLLDSSALENGEFELERVGVPLRASLEALLHRLGSVTAAHPVRIEVDPDLQVEVDPSLFEHVLENLLTNVAKHTPQGTDVEVRAEVHDDLVEVSVTDDGPGIAASDIPHVLDRFYRGGEPDRRPSGGLGLGLALSSQIVQAHGSRLEVTSEEGAGTRFSFEVPVAR